MYKIYKSNIDIFIANGTLFAVGGNYANQINNSNDRGINEFVKLDEPILSNIVHVACGAAFTFFVTGLF